MEGRSRPAVARRKLPVVATLRRIGAAYRAQWRLLVGGATLVFVPLSALETLEHDVGTIDLSEDQGLRIVAVLLLVAATFVVSTLGNHLYGGLVGEVAAELRTGERHPSLGGVLRSLPYARLVAIDLLATAAIAGGLLLFIVPGVLAFGWLSLAAPLATMEDLGVRASLRRSRELVRGSFWRVVGVLLVLLIPIEAASEMLQAALGAVAGAGPTSDWLAASIASSLLGPVLALATVVMAYELLAMKGGREPGTSAPAA